MHSLTRAKHLGYNRPTILIIRNITLALVRPALEQEARASQATAPSLIQMCEMFLVATTGPTCTMPRTRLVDTIRIQITSDKIGAAAERPALTDLSTPSHDQCMVTTTIDEMEVLDMRA